MTSHNNRSKKILVRFLSLGCPKNLVDSEAMLDSLNRDLFEVVSDDDEPCHVGVVNTCGFIEEAKEESIQTILELAEDKKRGRLQILIVAGCLSQRYQQELPQLLPEVDAFIGVGDFTSLPEVIQTAIDNKKAGKKQKRYFIRKSTQLILTSPQFKLQIGLASTTGPQGKSSRTVVPTTALLVQGDIPRNRLTPFYTRYIKVSEGCTHECSFCTIPLIRGGLKSRPSLDIVSEMRHGVDDGVKEFNFIAQDLNEYGRDLEPRESLFNLLEKLIPLQGDYWLRLLYLYPLHFPNKLTRLIKNHPHIVPYVDIPLQHIDDRILKSMKRGTSARYIYRLIENLKKEIPNIVIRTTFITGYPGETEKEFKKLYDFLCEVEFDRVGVFTYSNEEGTKAYHLHHQISDQIKEERKGILMKAQQEISIKKNRSYVGKTIKVLYEGKLTNDDILDLDALSQKETIFGKGRFYGQAPEIDGQVLITTSKKDQSVSISIGDFIQVRVTHATPYDLIGELTEVFLI